MRGDHQFGGMGERGSVPKSVRGLAPKEPAGAPAATAAAASAKPPPKGGSKKK